MKKKTETQNDKFINLFTKLYTRNGTTIITICWLIASLHITMVYNFQDCININDEKNTFYWILWIALAIIFIVYIPIIGYFFINREKIGKEKLSEIEDSEEGNFGFSRRDPKIFILPMYLLWVFSLSKLVVIVHQYFNKEISEDITVKIVVLLIILTGSFWAWISFKKISSKSWSFWITVFAISYVLVNIYWEYFLPYLQSYIKTWHCIFKSLI